MPEMAFNIKPDNFPFAIEILSDDTGQLLWSEIVTGPGAIAIPGNAELGGRPVNVRMTMANGAWYHETHDGKVTSGHS